MIAQDTGGAIIGPARADIYFGAGDEAGRDLGPLQAPRPFVMLLPKSVDPFSVRRATFRCRGRGPPTSRRIQPSPIWLRWPRRSLRSRRPSLTRSSRPRRRSLRPRSLKRKKPDAKLAAKPPETKKPEAAKPDAKPMAKPAPSPMPSRRFRRRWRNRIQARRIEARGETRRNQEAGHGKARGKPPQACERSRRRQARRGEQARPEDHRDEEAQANHRSDTAELTASMSRRKLSPDERTLWYGVTRSIAPFPRSQLR